MPEQAAQQGQAAPQGGSRPSAGPRMPESRTSSRSTVIGVAGALLMAAAIAGVVMMGGPASPPSAVAPTSAVAPATVPAPVEPAQATAPVTNVAPALPPVVAPALPPVAAPAPAPAISNTTQLFAPPLNTPGQCKIGQVQQLSINLSATLPKEIGNVIRVHSGSYVSPPIVLTKSAQTVTFPAPPGSTDSARIMIEQKNVGGSTFDDDANGITIEFESTIDSHRDYLLLRWTTPRC
jgi:hypothetical protein